MPAPAFAFRPDHLQRSTRYAPLVGFAVGAIAAGAYFAARTILPVWPSAAIATAAAILATGAFHEDGFADSCDAFGGGMTPEQTLRIMRDSRVGAFGAIGVSILIVLRVSLLAAIDEAAILSAFLVAHSFSRIASATIMIAAPYVRMEEEESKAKPVARGIGAKELLIGWALTGIVMALCNAPLGLAVLAIVAPNAALLAGWTLYIRRRIGGYTGDALGAGQQISEVCVYVVFVVLAPAALS